MIRCPRCDVEVEPTWERCAGCGLAAEDVTLGDLTQAAASRPGEVLTPHAPPPYHGDRSSAPAPARVAMAVAVAVVLAVLALLWLVGPFNGTIAPL